MTVGERFVGQRVLRHEDPRFLTGRGRYVDDIPMPGVLHVAFARSDVARGAIASVDTSAAVAMPGVVAVYADGDLDALFHDHLARRDRARTGDRPFRLFAADDVRCVGEPIAMVVADSRYRAEDAVDAVVVEIESAIPSWTSRARSTPTRRSCTRAPNRISGTRSRRRRDPGAGRAPRVGPGRADGDVPPAPLRDGADGDARGPRELGAARRTAHRMDLHAGAAQRPRVPGAGDGARRQPDPRDHAGRRRGVRPQDESIRRRRSRPVLASRRLGRPVKWIQDRRENLMADEHAREDQPR